MTKTTEQMINKNQYIYILKSNQNYTCRVYSSWPKQTNIKQLKLKQLHDNRCYITTYIIITYIT